MRTSTREERQNKDFDPSQECRPAALRFSKEIVELVNKKYDEEASKFGPIIATLTLQNVLILSLMESCEPGSEEGLKAINTFFDHCKFTMANHWRSPLLNAQFKLNKRAAKT